MGIKRNAVQHGCCPRKILHIDEKKERRDWKRTKENPKKTDLGVSESLRDDGK